MADRVDHAFLAQINAHVGIAHKVCRMYVQDAEEQADLLQEMLYQLWKSYSSFDSRSRFSTWMYRVCLNTALSWHRKTTRINRERLSLKHQQIPEPALEPVEENIQALSRAIGTLSPLNKAIVLLYLEEVSYEEIASITGLTKSNVSVRLVRIKKELELQLKQQTNPTHHVTP